MKRRLAISVALLALALLVAVPAWAASPSSTSVSISSTATQTTATTIVVTVSVTCVPFNASAGFTQVAVSQQQPNNVFATGFGFQNVTCDGSAHKYVLLVTSMVPWVLGQANAQAFACGFVCGSANRTIRITAP